MKNLTRKQKAEATIEFMSLFRIMLREARYFTYNYISLTNFLIEDIEKKKQKAEDYLKANADNGLI